MMHRTIFMLSCILLGLFAGSAFGTTVQAGSNLSQEAPQGIGVASDGEVAPNAPLALSLQQPLGDVTATRLVVSKSLRLQDFSPVIETSLFSLSDYSAYAHIHFNTGASSRTIRLRWRWVRPDGSSFNNDSPWWTFGTQGRAASWLELQEGTWQTGRWRVQYYVQLTESGEWNWLGEQAFFINPGLLCSQFLENGGFEAGNAGWQKSGNTLIPTTKPHWGTMSAWLGGSNSSYYYLYQDVTLPPAASGELSLAYYYNLFTHEASGGAYDFFRIQIRDTSNRILTTLDLNNNNHYYSRNPRDLWQPFTWDLSAYANQRIRVWVEVQTDYSLPTTWYLDDFSLTKCTSSRSFSVKVILAEPADVTHKSSHNRAYYENLMESVRSYHVENSMGRVQLGPIQIYDNGASWFKLSRNHAEYASNPLEFVREAEQMALGTTDIPNDTIVVVVHAGKGGETDGEDHIHSQTWEPPSSPNGNEIIVSEYSPIGVWSHEIGHDLGSLFVNSVTPDLYRMGTVEKWDLMATGSWNGSWFSSGNNPPHMSSYTKEFLGLLRYQSVGPAVSGSYWIDVLPRRQLDDQVLQYVLERRPDGTPDKFYIVETRNRSRSYSRWDRSVPDTGVVLYWVDTKGTPKYGDYANNIRTTINQVALLEPPSLFGGPARYFDADNLLEFRVVERRETGGDYALKVEISTPAPDPIWLAGAILRPEGTVASAVAPWYSITAPSIHHLYQPDLDLHVYTSDGRHIGMNYATGEYEILVEGALVSGNRLNAPEWILLPAGVNYQYVVRSVSTEQFLQQNPTAAAFTDGTDNYGVYGLISSPSTGFVSSPTRQEAIARSVDQQHVVSITGSGTQIDVQAAAPVVLPVDLAVDAVAPTLVSAGDMMTYTIAFGNSGGMSSSGVVLRVQKPSNVDLVAAPGFIHTGGDQYSYNVPALDVGSRRQVVFVVRALSALQPGTPIIFRAAIADDGVHGGDGVPLNNQVDVYSYVYYQTYLPLITQQD